ncbi:MAG: TIGR03067 domain-containing protein [Gemmataceae bacterium]|nr:TIGR03067 domain-containing protein [Gemmata sp.]MDW8198103.1 TIGR03067 domain-containing protein [Gemmataceae bacterium]
MFTATWLMLALAAPAEWPEPVQKELKALEGEWVVVAIAHEGKERELTDDEQVVITITSGKFTHPTLGSGQVTALDPTTDPKIVDFKMLRQPESGFINEAIYKLEQDTLTVVMYLGDDKRRPASFAVPTDNQTLRFTLKRRKP